MAEKVTFDGLNKIIIIENGIEELDFYSDVYSAWKRWILLNDNSKYEQAIRVVGGDPISSTKILGSTFFMLNNWKLRPYEGDHRLIINGNIYTDPAGSSIFTSTLGNYNIIIEMAVSNLSDSTLSQLPEIEYSSYNNTVTIDIDNGSSGSTYPIGTPRYPVNNLTEAKLIADTGGFDDYTLLSSLTIRNGDNLNNLKISAKNWEEIIIESGALLENTEFSKISLYGTMSGYWNVLNNCWVYDIDNFTGWMRNCSFVSVSLAEYTEESNGQSYFDNNIPMFPNQESILNMNTDTFVSFTFASGIYKIKNMTTGSEIVFGLSEGMFIIDDTCVGGLIEVTGIGEVVNSSSLSPKIDNLVRGEEIQIASFNNGITIDEISGSDSIIYPAGTVNDPVKTLLNVSSIARERGFKYIYVVNDLTLSGIPNGILNGYKFVGCGYKNTRIYVDNVQLINCQFKDCLLTGSFYDNSSITVNNCIINDISNITIDAIDCYLSGSIELNNTIPSNFYTCVDGIPGNDTPIILVNDCNSLGFWKYSGGITLKNIISNTNISMNLSSGRVILDSTCVTGSVIVRGVGSLENNSIGTYINSNGLIDNNTISSYVWDSQLSNYTDTGSAGNSLSNISAGANPQDIAQAVWSETTSSYLSENTFGYQLSQNTPNMLNIISGYAGHKNFRIKNQNYNSTGNLLSATLKIYNSKDNTINDISPTNILFVSASYDLNNRLVDYFVTD